MAWSWKLQILIFLCILSVRVLAACPSNCNGGTCSAGNTCVCPQHYFGDDCSIRATQITTSDKLFQGAPHGDWVFFYFLVSEYKYQKEEVNQNTDQFLLYLYKPQGVPASIVTNFQALNNYTLPTSSSFQPLESYEDSFVGKFSPKTMQANYENMLVIGVQSSSSDKIYIKASYMINLLTPTQLILFVAIPVALFSFLLFICTLYYYHRRQIVAPPGRIHLPPQSPQHKYEDVEHYFSKAKFSDLKSEFDQKLCCICIDTFNSDSMCVQLYCQHIFHQDCISAWLSQHTTCPDCRKEMTVEAITEYYEKQKKALQMENQTQTIETERKYTEDRLVSIP